MFPTAENPRSNRRLGAPLRVALAATLLSPILLACASGGDVAHNLKADGPYKYTAKHNLLTNHLARNQDGTINVVVEIPAGTSEKWEVSEDGSALVRDFSGDQPRVIDYLPYLGNYGLIPRTLLDEEKGGDGGALDVMLLGPAVDRGQSVRARAIGVIRVVDRMEQDDKILAVMDGATFKDVYDMESLRLRYPGVTEIIDIWWTHAHGKASQVSLLGTGSRGQANAVIDYAHDSWKSKRSKQREEKPESK